jgi:hypothetical protein
MISFLVAERDAFFLLLFLPHTLILADIDRYGALLSEGVVRDVEVLVTLEELAAYAIIRWLIERSISKHTG